MLSNDIFGFNDFLTNPPKAIEAKENSNLIDLGTVAVYDPTGKEEKKDDPFAFLDVIPQDAFPAILAQNHVENDFTPFQMPGMTTTPGQHQTSPYS